MQYHVSWLGLVSIVLVGSICFQVDGHDSVAMPLFGIEIPTLCAMRRYTSIPCPGCGLTRAFVSIGSGDFRNAWSYNPASFIWFAALLSQFPFRIVQIWRLRNGREEIRVRHTVWIWAVLVSVLFIAWLYRLTTGY